MRIKIRLETQSDVLNFVNATSALPECVILEGCDEFGQVYQVSAKSLLGALYAMEWNTIWCLCDTDVSSHIRQFEAA